MYLTLWDYTVRNNCIIHVYIQCSVWTFIRVFKLVCFYILKVLISPGLVFHLRTVTMHGNTREMQHISCDLNHFQDDLSNYQFLCQAAMTFLRNTDEGSKSWSGNMSRIILYSPRLATFTHYQSIWYLQCHKTDSLNQSLNNQPSHFYKRKRKTNKKTETVCSKFRLQTGFYGFVSQIKSKGSNEVKHTHKPICEK